MREFAQLLQVKSEPAGRRPHETVWALSLQGGTGPHKNPNCDGDVNGNAIVREPTGADTFKAVEGLGLKLEERREPLDVLVVDTINRTPTENQRLGCGNSIDEPCVFCGAKGFVHVEPAIR